MFSRTQNLFSLTAGLAVLCGAAFISPADAADAGSEETVGYYPTFEESDFLATRDHDYLRDPNQPLSGPDLDRWAATGGIWPYEYESGGLSRVQRFFQPVDYILRPLTPGETIAIQGPTSESWIQLAGSFPFLSRSYHRERSHLSDLLGMENTNNIPLFFDVLAVSVTALYSDVSGPGFDDTNLEDGFLGAVSLSFRGGLAITDRTSLLIAGEVYFVFGNDSDVQFYVDCGNLGALASVHFQEQVGTWDIHIFDDLTPFSQRQLFYQESYQGHNVQSTGHYYLGIPKDLESGSWWDSRRHYLLNSAGITAGTFVGPSWKFLAGAGRLDTWQWNDFDEHDGNEYLNAGLFYDGYESWIAPSLTYTLHTHDFSDPQQTVMLNVVAPLSSNITFNAGVGYDWGDAYDGWDWNAGLRYQQTDRLSHWVSYASGYQDSIFFDDFTGNRFQYGVSYKLGSRITFGGYAAWFESTEADSNAVHFGGSANIALGNYSSFRLIAGYLDSDDTHTEFGDGSQWVYSATFMRRLAERLNGELTYEYTDNNVSRYTEQALLFRLTRTF